MLQTKYITLDDFRDYFVDVDLRVALGTEESAIAFLKRIEDRMETFLESNFNKNIDMQYKCFTDYQKKHYKRALLEQAIYVFKNGDLSVDSGFDPERGVITDIETIKKISLAPNAKQELILCGLWSRALRGSRSYYDGWFRP